MQTGMDATAPPNGGAVNPTYRQTTRRGVCQFSGVDGLEARDRMSKAGNLNRDRRSKVPLLKASPVPAKYFTPLPSPSLLAELHSYVSDSLCQHSAAIQLYQRQA